MSYDDKLKSLLSRLEKIPKPRLATLLCRVTRELLESDAANSPLQAWVCLEVAEACLRGEKSREEAIQAAGAAEHAWKTDLSQANEPNLALWVVDAAAWAAGNPIEPSYCVEVLSSIAVESGYIDWGRINEIIDSEVKKNGLNAT